MLDLRDFYWYLKVIRSRQRFTLDGKSYRYFIAKGHNNPSVSERIVEVPIMWDFAQKNKGKTILEIGNVLSHYFRHEHEIIDKYEKGSRVVNEDIVSFSPGRKYDCILSISTLEHVGFDENRKEPDKISRAIENIKNLLAPNGEFLFTVPLGYNNYLDDLVRDNRLNVTKTRFLKRTTILNKWKEVDYDQVWDAQFNKPYPFANALLVGYWKNVSPFCRGSVS